MILHNRAWPPGFGLRTFHSVRFLLSHQLAATEREGLLRYSQLQLICCSLLCVSHLFPFLVVDAKLLRHRLECGIELNESVLDCGMCFVT